MDDLSKKVDAPLDPRSALEPPAEPIHKISQLSQLPPTLSQLLSARLAGWETINEQRGFYDEHDSLHPNHNLASRKLQNRGSDEVVIFDYSLTPASLSGVDGPTPEGGGASSERISADDDVFLRVPKKMLTKSKQFTEIINPTKEPRLMPSWGTRLHIVDFPQCYDTYDDSPPSSIGEKLGLRREGEDPFMGLYLPRVQTLPGCGLFRTGTSLRVPFTKLPESSRSSTPEDRFIFLVSFPYFGGSSEKITLGPERESIKLLDFKSLRVSAPDRKAVVSKEGKDAIGEIPVEEGEILVHQARYMIFDNYTMATFKSREDSAKDQVPLHPFQERICALRAMIHMISNRMGSEVWILEKHSASLCELEAGINLMMSTKREYGDGGRMDRALGLLTAINTLSANLFATISVTERQVAVLQDLHGVFSTGHQTKIEGGKKEYQLLHNPFFKDIAQAPVLSGYPERVWPNILGTIDEVVRERKSFIKKIKGLVENVDIRRKILSAFVKSHQAPPMIQGDYNTVNSGNSIMSEYQHTQQMQTLDGIAIMTTVFLSLSFCTSYFGMNIKEFKNPPSQVFFWLISGPICAAMVLLTVIIISWGRPRAVKFRDNLRKKLPLFPKKKIKDIEDQRQDNRQDNRRGGRQGSGQGNRPSGVQPAWAYEGQPMSF
ncbi:hypothetical protein B9Z19DRAFT_1190008 [Tuber borchii]|uniref:Uncharacterized protein n=1 Tax=Tuber borchii TaxID=42251 RepID=A0A2T7A5F9_TUBBO|nr:hypothetical protein B9Z19DRAFT_1190008 [Tuber borchii]